MLVPDFLLYLVGSVALLYTAAATCLGVRL
jgi:hypothetical protein